MLPQRNPIKVFLADDSAEIRSRVAGRLQALAMVVVGEGATLRGCIDGILNTHPDVVVLDVQLEDGSGLQVMRAVLATGSRVRFVVFSNVDASVYRQRFLENGALEFLDKSQDYQRLGEAVQKAAAA